MYLICAAAMLELQNTTSYGAAENMRCHLVLGGVTTRYEQAETSATM